MRALAALIVAGLAACAAPGVRVAPDASADEDVDSGTDGGDDAGPCGPMPDTASIPGETGQYPCAVECPADPFGCPGRQNSDYACYLICGYAGCCECHGTDWQFVRVDADCWADAGPPSAPDAGSDSGPDDAGACGPMPDSVSVDPENDMMHCPVECPPDPDACIGQPYSSETCYQLCGWGGCCQCSAGGDWQFRAVVPSGCTSGDPDGGR